MKVVKEGFLPKMGLRPGVRMWKLNEQRKRGGRGLKIVGVGVAAGALTHSLCLPLPYPTGKRPKKGLATAKQRLGRILKIHRNGKLLL